MVRFVLAFRHILLPIWVFQVHEDCNLRSVGHAASAGLALLQAGKEWKKRGFGLLQLASVVSGGASRHEQTVLSAVEHQTAKRLQCSGTHLDQQGLLCGDAGAGGLVDGQKEDFVPKTPKAPLLVFFEWNFSQRNGGLAGLCQAGNRRRSLETGSLVSGTGSGLYKR